MNRLTKLLLLSAICIAVITFTAKPAFAAEVDDDALCDISVTVNPMMEWAGDFTAITLTAIDAYADEPNDSEVQTLYTNCNLTIDADQAGTTAQLTSATDALTTEYKLEQDGNGTTTTGATPAEETASGIDTWTVHSSFLSTVLPITHFDGDGAVVITLHVQASCPSGEMPDQGAYNADQTLTAVWTSD